MKKAVSLMLIFCLILLVFSACAGKNKEVQSIKEALDELPVELDDETSELPDKIDDLGKAADVDITPPPASKAKIKISAVLPEGWTEEKRESSVASYIKDANVIEVFDIEKIYGASSIEELVEFEKETIKSAFGDDAKLYDTENTKVSGMDAIRLPIDVSFAGIKQRQTYIYFEKGGSFYKIVLGCFPDDEEGMKEMDSIIESMKIE